MDPVKAQLPDDILQVFAPLMVFGGHGMGIAKGLEAVADVADGGVSQIKVLEGAIGLTSGRVLGLDEDLLEVTVLNLDGMEGFDLNLDSFHVCTPLCSLSNHIL